MASQTYCISSPESFLGRPRLDSSFKRCSYHSLKGLLPFYRGYELWVYPAEFVGSLGLIVGYGCNEDGEQPAKLLGLWAPRARLRYTAHEALRVCAAVGYGGVFPLRDAPGGVCNLWRAGRDGAVGARQAPAHRHLRLVPGQLGQASELEGGVFHTTWEKVFRAMEMAIEWGRAHQDLSDITAFANDEIKWRL